MNGFILGCLADNKGMIPYQIYEYEFSVVRGYNNFLEIPSQYFGRKYSIIFIPDAVNEMSWGTLGGTLELNTISTGNLKVIAFTMEQGQSPGETNYIAGLPPMWSPTVVRNFVSIYVGPSVIPGIVAATTRMSGKYIIVPDSKL